MEGQPMPDENPHRIGHSGRENMLAIMLSMITLAGFGVFLIVVTGGLLLQIAGIVLIGIVVGWFHYRLWGRSLVTQTAGEREEAELRAKLEKDQWEQGPYGPRNE